MIQNFIIVRDGETFQAKEPLPFIEFSCSYGWSHRGASNKFSVKTNYSGSTIPLGDFIQLGTSNWCGQVLNVDIDFKEKTALYTGDSLYAVVDHFIPVRTAETIECYSITSVDTHGEGRSASQTRLNAILAAYPDKWTNAGVVKRANEQLELAYFPIAIWSRNTTPGNITNPNDSSWLAAYTSYRFYTLGRTASIFYGSDNNIYFDENPPSSVNVLLTVRIAIDEVEFTSRTPLLQSFEDRLDIQSFTRMEIGRNNLTNKDYIGLGIVNRFFEESEDTILLDKFQAPVYYHEKMIPNMVPFSEDTSIIALYRNGTMSGEIAAANSADFDELEGAANLYKGGMIYFTNVNADDYYTGRDEYEAFIKEQKLTYDHSLEIYDDEYGEEYEVGKTYRLLSFEAGINVKADIYEKIMTATPNGTKVAYNFRENTEEE